MQVFYSPLVRVERKDKVYNVIAIVASAGFISQTSTGGQYASLYQRRVNGLMVMQNSRRH